MPSVFFHTLGCKLNQAETEKLMHRFMDAGFTVSVNGLADVCILNTCTVTHIADRKSRHFVRFIKKNNPGSLIVAAGCYAQRESEDLKKAGADLVIGNDRKQDIVNLVEKAIREKPFSLYLSDLAKLADSNRVEPSVTVKDFSNEDLTDYLTPANRVRSFIKIQDGCTNFCTYCVVPLVRNVEYSVQTEQVINEINHRIDYGYREVVLTGTEICRYRCVNDRGTDDLKLLVQKILKETGIPRLHLSSLQPQEISADFLQLWGDSRMQRHFHLALQSGVDSVLSRMNRPYTVTGFETAMSTIRSQVPEASITTDLMVGFPNESDEEFEKSYEFCKAQEFSGIHVFMYSQRPGTVASSMKGQIDTRVKKLRSLKMLSLARKSAKNFRQNFVGQVAEVLFEDETFFGSGVYSGFTGNYIRVFVKSKQPLTNRIMPVKFIKNSDLGLWGESLP